jgi:hypothetical protein
MAGEMAGSSAAGLGASELSSFYSDARVGSPKLIFGEESPIGWFVPVVKGDDVAGFFMIDSYSGSIMAAPWWAPGGSAGFRIDEQLWNDLEGIVSQWLGMGSIAEARFIAIGGREGATLYMAAPGPSGTIRVDVSSLWSREGFSPSRLSARPEFEQKVGVPTVETPGAEGMSEWVDGEPRDIPSYFTLAVLPTVKDQANYGSCTGQAAHSAREWWECGLICYHGTGDSEYFTCDCTKGSQGQCTDCITTLLSREFMYDRTRSWDGNDCMYTSFCTDRGCGQNPCTDLWVTDGDMIQSNLYCSQCGGAGVETAANVLVHEGTCTEACQPYPGYGYAGQQHGGCTDGGRGMCTGVCPDVGDPCGDDFRLAEWQQRWNVEEICEGVYHSGPSIFGANLCSPCWYWSTCTCNPCPCPTWGGHAMMIAGYNNNSPTRTFYIQNSWGLSWGNGGRANTSQAWWEAHGHGPTFTFLGVKVLDVDIEPEGISYSRGDTLRYHATITNLTDEAVQFIAKAYATLPNGNPYPLLEKQLTLQPYAVLQRDMWHKIPNMAPFGFYGYTVEAVALNPPGMILDKDTFGFSIMF